MKHFVAALIFLFSSQAFAFPQLIRHGYTNCTSCHASPRGGGVLTEYGRALSKEILSTWGYEGEETWHYGAINKDSIADWLRVGGDVRAVQVHNKNERATVGRFIEMQEQVELAGQFNNTWLSISASADTMKTSKPWYIPGFYFLTNLTEKLNIRVGRFVPRFGLNTPEHIFSTRGPIGFGYQAERDTAEVTYSAERWDVSFAASTGRLHSKETADGFYGQANYSFTTHDKWGISIGKQTTGLQNQTLGIHGLMGFTERLYLETDSVLKKGTAFTGGSQRGIYHFAKVGYEIEKGLHLIALEDVRKDDLSLNNSTQFMYGAGLAFYPRPHFEFQGVLSKRTRLAQSHKEEDYFWLLMHFYL